MKKEDFQTFLPGSFTCKIIKFEIDFDNVDHFSAIVRTDISSEIDADKWLADFKNNSSTNWIVKQNYGELKSLLYRKDFVCHHSTKNKTLKENLQKNGFRSKATGCNASVKIKVAIGLVYEKTSCFSRDFDTLFREIFDSVHIPSFSDKKKYLWD